MPKLRVNELLSLGSYRLASKIRKIKEIYVSPKGSRDPDRMGQEDETKYQWYNTAIGFPQRPCCGVQHTERIWWEPQAEVPWPRRLKGQNQQTRSSGFWLIQKKSCKHCLNKPTNSKIGEYDVALYRISRYAIKNPGQHFSQSTLAYHRSVYLGVSWKILSMLPKTKVYTPMEFIFPSLFMVSWMLHSPLWLQPQRVS